MSQMSAATAEAVASPPAPGPTSVKAPIASQVYQIGAELGESGFEVVQVLPDFGTGAVGILRRRLVDRILREQGRRFRRRILEGREDLMRLVEIERSLALDHGGADLALVAIGFHQRLARGDRVLLGYGGGDAKRNRRNRKYGTNHVMVSPLGGTAPKQRTDGIIRFCRHA